MNPEPPAFGLRRMLGVVAQTSKRKAIEGWRGRSSEEHSGTIQAPARCFVIHLTSLATDRTIRLTESLVIPSIMPCRAPGSVRWWEERRGVPSWGA